MTQALGMAPGLASLVMYVGSTDAAIFNAMATAKTAERAAELFLDLDPGGPEHGRSVLRGVCGAGAEPLPGGRRQRRVDDSGQLRRFTRRMMCMSRRWAARTWRPARRPGAWSSETAWVRWRRRHFAGQVCDSFVADGRGQRLRKLLAELSQRPGRFSQREFHLLRLRRPDHLHRERVWRNQLSRHRCGPAIWRW